MAVAGRYNVPYSAAVAAVAPAVLSKSLDQALERYEESAPDEEDGADDGEGPRELVDESVALQATSKHMQKVIAKAIAEDTAADEEDDELKNLLLPYADAATQGMRGAGARVRDEGDEDAAATLVRFTRLGGVVHRAVDRAKALAARASGKAGSDSASPSPFSIEPLGDKWAHIGSEGSDPEADLGAFRNMLESLRDVGGSSSGLGITVPSLEDDYGLTPLDLQTIASAAEVDPNTLANVVPMRKSDLLEALRA